MKKRYVFLTASAVLIFSAVFLLPGISSFAEDSTADLKKEIAELRAEVAALKAAGRPDAAAVAADPVNSWGYRSSTFWDPFAEMQQMQDYMNRMFRDSFRRSSALPGFYEPDLDIQDQGDHYLVKLDLPGLDKDKINIAVTAQDIVVSGERHYQNEEQDDKQGFYRMERRFGSFSRRLPLPEDASQDGIEAGYEKGVLEIRIPKKEAAASKEEVKQVKVS